MLKYSQGKSEIMKNKVEPKTLSGFMELMPQDQILFSNIKRTIEEVYASYGYYELDTPIIESSEVLLAKAGGETEKQIYRFQKGDSDLSLRFDLTVPLAKYVAARYNELTFPFKRYQIGKVYRGERAQKGRFREFYQCDIDVIGNESLSLMYDVEIPSIIYDIFKKLNFGKFQIQINNRKLLSGFFDALELNDLVSDILRVIDKIDKIGLDAVKDELKLLDISDDKIEKIAEFILIEGTTEEKIEKLENLGIQNDTFKEGLEELKFVIEGLKCMNVDSDYYTINLTIARGLDYYTGTVYETKLVDYPSIGSVCSGGRYEDLAGYYTDQKLPGVGISIGLTRLFYQLKEAGIITSSEVSASDVAILPMTMNYAYICNVLNKVKGEGLKAEVVYLNKFKQLMRFADKNNIPYVIIIGDDEINNNEIAIKNMATGEQTKVKLDDISKIKEIVKR